MQSSNFERTEILLVVNFYAWKYFLMHAHRIICNRFISHNFFFLLSATGGADSRPISEKGSPTEETPGAVGNGK